MFKLTPTRIKQRGQLTPGHAIRRGVGSLSLQLDKAKHPFMPKLQKEKIAMAMRKLERLYFSDDVVWQLAPPAPLARGKVWFQDEAIPELRLIVTNSRRAWYFYKTVDYKRVSLKLGEFPRMTTRDARAVIEPMLKGVQFGEDPKRARPKALKKRLPDYGDVFKLYYENYICHHKKPKAIREVMLSFKRCHGAFADKRVDEIRREDVQAWLNQLGEERGHQTANREFHTFQAVLHYGEKMSLYQLDIDPTKHIEKFPESRRGRFLNRAEVAKLFAVLETKPEYQRDIVRLALFTAARKGNILAAEWAEVDTESKTWTISALKAKHGKVMVLPLSDEAVEIFARRKASGTRHHRWVFPSQHRLQQCHSASGHIENFDQAWRRIRQEAGLNDVHFHDLRHTTASWMGMAGVNAFTLMQILGHTSIATTQKYTHLNQENSLKAAQNFSMQLATVIPISNPARLHGGLNQ